MGSHPTFSIEAVVRNDVVNFALRGELDMATVPIMEQQLVPYEEDGVGALLLDLRGVTFLDTTAVHAFTLASERARSSGKQFILLGATDGARRIFELTKTEHLLDDEASAQLLERFLGDQASDPSALPVPSDG